MEFPFNHSHNSHATHTHHHNNRRDDEEQSANYPPPPGSGGSPFSSFNNPYPPPQQPPFYGEPQPETHVFHSSHVTSGHVSHDFDYAPPHPPPQSHHHQEADHSLSYGYPGPAPAPPFADYSAPPPPNATVHHVSHETSRFPTSVHHVSHETPHQGPIALSGRPTFRIVTKANPDYALTIRQGQVILAPFHHSNEYQRWYKDEKYSTRVKDEEGCPAFSLVNKATGEAIKHSIGASHPVTSLSLVYSHLI